MARLNQQELNMPKAKQTRASLMTGFFSSLTLLGIMAGSAHNAESEPFITVEHPAIVKQLGGQQYKKVDCGELVRWEGKTWMTCEFARQVDSNSQNICADTTPLPENSEKKKNLLSQKLYLALHHFASQHKVCKLQAEFMARQLGKSTAPYEGASAHCPLTEAANMCKTTPSLGR